LIDRYIRLHHFDKSYLNLSDHIPADVKALAAGGFTSVEAEISTGAPVESQG
jgi:hypothetical protein